MNYQLLINITFRTLLAMFIGGLIGWERESTHRPAGLRTHMLVAVGSCAIMQLGSFNATHIGAEFNVDPSRLGAQVISGIGFLGAGTIIKESQAGLSYHYGIPKYQLKEKMFGVFQHYINDKNAELTRGLDDKFYAPHSRHTEVKRKDIEKVPELEILSESDEAGIFIVANKNRRQIFITGHLEYERNTLSDEYFRDVNKGLEINKPKNYFPKDNPNLMPIVTWRGTANIVFSNWLNYCVYQNTPYDLNNL